jgi:hypothetical protein
LTFQDARLKLLAYVRNEVRNGELTERRFARLVGISQPHAHNVLKGVRTLSPQIFDLALRYFHLSLLDLASFDEIEAQFHRRRARERRPEVAFFVAPVEPGRPFPAQLNWRKTFPLPFPAPSIPADLAMARIAADPEMAVSLASYDIALLDLSERGRSAISARGLFVIERDGEAVVRYIRWGGRCRYLVSDERLDAPIAWERVFNEKIKARVVWLGRERDRDAPVQRGEFLYDPISS